MITSSIKELNNARAKVASLEQALTTELASLPDVYGFKSLDEFVAAIKAAAGKGKEGQPTKAAGSKSRKRAKITDVIRAKVKALAKEGKTGSYIAKVLGISLPSVQNIKKALGLVKARTKAASKTKAKTSVTRIKVKNTGSVPKEAISKTAKEEPAPAHVAES
jgi:hypothetical protein